ncbi:unnamed protein product [Arctogadus glacialis]
MSTNFSFNSQLVSIMDALSKTAVLEIGKLVQIESKMLKIEINRGRNEIASLTEKLQLMEKLLWIAQGHRQDTAGRSITRDSEITCGELDGGATIQPIKSESLQESICPSTETTNEDEESFHQRFTDKSKEQPVISVIKEEPPEEQTSELSTQQELETDTREAELQTQPEKRRSDVPIHPKSASSVQLYIPCFSITQTLASSNAAAPAGFHETSCNQNLLLRPTPASHNTNNNNKIDTSGKTLVCRNAASKGLGPARSLAPAKSTRIQGLLWNSEMAKRFGCAQCGKSFRCFSQLEIHQRSHTGEKPFRCTLCGKRYAQKGHLYTHQRTHTGEKPYGCPICGKGFIQKCTLDMHQRTHTGEKPFVCGQCGKGFTKNCNLKKHLAVHADVVDGHSYNGESIARHGRPVGLGPTNTTTTTTTHISVTQF